MDHCHCQTTAHCRSRFFGSFCRRLALSCGLAGLLVAVCQHVAAADGEAVWNDRCASCHGGMGEGTTEFPAPLFGDRPTVELAGLIERTMPDGSPEDCVGEEARAVAEWIQQKFYSPEAQARLHPPRVSLSRLTVSQYRNAVADLSTSFQWLARAGDKSGLSGSYYADRRFRRDQRKIERVDPQVDFPFAAGSPDAEQIPPEEFSIQWRGSLIVQQTGWYEFILKTENGAKLFVNNPDTPLIDVWVRSGSETTFRASRYLLAGRIYPLSLDWFKFKEPTASVALMWKPPFGVEEVIPARHLTPENSPPLIIPETAFPPD
ncbi:MAG: c-type cytochrome, partial [Planctomycetaceae bacterium]|nr:c-type cytochrome [Planctomycetaceae bacterium]